MITLTVNGKAHEVDVDPDTPLLYVLRNDLELNGAKFGCGLAQCGACTVHVDGKPMRSCSVPIGSVAGKKITTLEGLGTPEQLLQQADCIPLSISRHQTENLVPTRTAAAARG
jgi:aerobic-type carbon monoxide dehydrogenase small subunit (CoxS/CutS family)